MWIPLLDEYHPQDLLALGLTLAGTACVARRQWVWAGVFLGMAVTPQQSALLVLAPLFVIAPGRARWRLLASAAGTALIVSLPFVIANSGSARGLARPGDHRLQSGSGFITPPPVLPLICIAIVLVLIIRDAVDRKVRWYLVAWIVIAACAALQWPLRSLDSLRAPLPVLFWQSILVPVGVLMAVSPLVRWMQGGPRLESPANV